MRKIIPILLALLALGAALAYTVIERRERPSIILATTTSTHDSGLLDVLVPMFEEQHGVEVKVIAVGTGAALKMAEHGDADALLVHAPTAERKLVDSGDLEHRTLVMHNDFLVVGPPDDPAGAREAGGLVEGLVAIARAGGFVTRADDSGTNQRELALWKLAGIDPTAMARLEQTGQGMGATLRVTSEHRSYTLTDRGTYLALSGELDLVPVIEGGAQLLNVYHAYLVSPSRHERVVAEPARAFVDFLVSPPAQDVIRDFRRAELGAPLFIPDAGRDDGELGE